MRQNGGQAGNTTSNAGYDDSYTGMANRVPTQTEANAALGIHTNTDATAAAVQEPVSIPAAATAPVGVGDTAAAAPSDVVAAATQAEVGTTVGDVDTTTEQGATTSMATPTRGAEAGFVSRTMTYLARSPLNVFGSRGTTAGDSNGEGTSGNGEEGGKLEHV